MVKAKLTTTQLMMEKKKDLLKSWTDAIRAHPGRAFKLITKAQLDKHTSAFLDELVKVISSEKYDDITAPEFDKLREMLREICRSCAEQGFTSSETAIFIFHLKDGLLAYMQDYFKDPAKLNAEFIAINKLIDALGIYTFETYAKSREDLIRQETKVLELALKASTPAIEVWEGVVAFPLIGILDTPRMKQLADTVLDDLIRTQSDIGVLDMAGIAAVDTKTAQTLLNLIQSARLVGAELIITGLNSEVAMTLTKLGVDLSHVTCLRQLRDGIEYAFKARKLKVISEE